MEYDFAIFFYILMTLDRFSTMKGPFEMYSNWQYFFFNRKKYQGKKYKGSDPFSNFLLDNFNVHLEFF